MVFLGIQYRGSVFFWGFRPGPGLVRKPFFGTGKYQEKQPCFYMRQKIRFTIFYLYHQNKTNKNNFCGPVAVTDEEIANTIFQVNTINLT